MKGEMAITSAKKASQTRFDVEVETANGQPLVVFQSVVAQTKAEAINKVKQKLTFSAERCTN